MRRILVLAWLFGCGGAALAGTTVYQCRADNGQLTYQDTPCSKAQNQRVLALPELPRAPSSSASIAAQPAPPIDETTPALAPAQPAASVPRMYRCVRATDGKSYVSQNGDPAPYLAPYGMLAAGQLPLSEAYGPTQGGAGISAPEANRGRVTTGLVADHYVWVQDQCRELSPQETCAALRDDLEQNTHALSRAFQSDRPPLEQRERALRAQLQGC